MNQQFLLYVISILLISCSASKNTSDEKREISLKFTVTADYCGGAHPNDKIINDLLTPKPYANKDIFISIENRLNDTMTTLSVNDNGVVNSTLSPRTYYIYLPRKVYANYTVGGNEGLCKKWKNTPDGTFNIENGIEEIEISVHKTCSPCGAARM